jgi:hypothetical protein
VARLRPGLDDQPPRAAAAQDACHRVRALDAAAARRHPPALLFETNWTGAWESYIDDFARIMPMQWRAVWGGAEQFSRAQAGDRACSATSKEHDHGADHFYSGYCEGATTHTVANALALQPRIRALPPRRGRRRARRVAAERWEDFLSDVQGQL